MSDNPAQVQLLGEIKTNIGEWRHNVTEPAIALRGEIGHSKTMNDMASPVGEAKGKVYFDRFRQQIKAFSLKEQLLIDERKKTALDATASVNTSIHTMEETIDWVVHTYKVIAKANSLLAAAVDMETGMRGFLLAGEDSFLDPYKKGKEEFFELLASLTSTVDDNPKQVRLLDAIDANIQEWNEKVTEPAIALRRQVGDEQTMDDVASPVGEARGKEYFDKFRDRL